MTFADLVAACRSALPQLDVDTGAFAAHVVACMPADHEPSRWLAEVHADDLYLAFACASGDAAALRVFRERYDADLERALSDTDTRGLDDARQLLDHRLFAGPRPKIASFTGRGPLRRWLRVVACRLLLEIIEDRDLLAHEDEIAALPVASDDPELAYLKTHYRTAYKAAFAYAIAYMSSRDRTVLAQYYVDLLTIDQLAALYAIHRSTAARWVSRAEDDLRDRVVGRLRQQLGISTSTLDQLTQLVRSRLTLSLIRALAPSS